MKRFVSMLLALVLVVSMTACGAATSAPPADEAPKGEYKPAEQEQTHQEDTLTDDAQSADTLPDDTVPEEDNDFSLGVMQGGTDPRSDGLATGW